jgi:hypothetical protein
VNPQHAVADYFGDGISDHKEITVPAQAPDYVWTAAKANWLNKN